MAQPDYSIRPLTAWRALKTLLADPEKTEQVFIIIRALSGRSLPRAYARFRKTATGARILNEKRSLLDTLSDREALRALPASGSACCARCRVSAPRRRCRSSASSRLTSCRSSSPRRTRP